MKIRWPDGLYGREMTAYIEDEMEVGTRAADFLDMENNWDRDWFADRGPRPEAGPGAEPELEAG